MKKIAIVLVVLTFAACGNGASESATTDSIVVTTDSIAVADSAVTAVDTTVAQISAEPTK
jgi:uncharacterized membrane protein YdfJ with MMPL/SSD domain